MGIGFSQLLLILVLFVAVFIGRRFLANRAGNKEGLSARAHKSRKEDVTVYSTETVKGEESEFVRVRQSRGWPIIIGLVIVAVMGATTWLFVG
jgi:hypothetical protein